MFNEKQLRGGEFLKAKWYSRNRDGSFEPPVVFYYKTYDDMQHRIARAQRQSGSVTEMPSVSIQTSANIDARANDKVELANTGFSYTITTVEDVQNHPNALLNLLVPESRRNVPMRLHLNKDV